MTPSLSFSQLPVEWHGFPAGPDPPQSGSGSKVTDIQIAEAANRHERTIGRHRLNLRLFGGLKRNKAAKSLLDASGYDLLRGSPIGRRQILHRS